jgi:hypothetical protein
MSPLRIIRQLSLLRLMIVKSAEHAEQLRQQKRKVIERKTHRRLLENNIRYHIQRCDTQKLEQVLRILEDE